MSKSSTPKTRPFHVIAGVQYDMEEVADKSFEIADWFHTYYSHLEGNTKRREKITDLAAPNGFHEEGNRIYVLV